MYGIDDCYQLTRSSGGFSDQCFVHAVLEKVRCSAAGNFMCSGIPSCFYFNWVKVLGNRFTGSFSIVPCSIINSGRNRKALAFVLSVVNTFRY